jgi:hypothetical protein
MMNFFKKDKSIIPFDTKSAPLAPATVLLRKNPCIPEPEHDGASTTDQKEDHLGREVRYETQIIFSPVYVPSRSSSSDKSLKTKRLVVTKDEMQGLNVLLENMLLEGNKGKEEEKIQDDETVSSNSSVVDYEEDNKKGNETPDEVPSCDSKTNKQYGRYTKTIRPAPTLKPVKVTRSCRVSA